MPTQHDRSKSQKYNRLKPDILLVRKQTTLESIERQSHTHCKSGDMESLQRPLNEYPIKGERERMNTRKAVREGKFPLVGQSYFTLTNADWQEMPSKIEFILILVSKVECQLKWTDMHLRRELETEGVVVTGGNNGTCPHMTAETIVVIKWNRSLICRIPSKHLSRANFACF